MSRREYKWVAAKNCCHVVVESSHISGDVCMAMGLKNKDRFAVTLSPIAAITLSNALRRAAGVEDTK